MVSVGITTTPASSRSTRSAPGGSTSARQRYPDATTLTITADSGGSNSNRTTPVEGRAAEARRRDRPHDPVCHFPPGTSKWNKIEHRLFSFVSLNWRGKPLESLEVIIDLIAATTTSTGLKVYAQLDERPYPKEVEVTDQELAAVNITRNPFHGEWNYTITPTTTQS